VDYNEHPVELNVSIEPGSQPFVKNLMIQNYLIAWAVCWWLVEIGCGWRMGVMGDGWWFLGTWDVPPQSAVSDICCHIRRL